MFSQKKKKSKGLLFLIPVLLVFLAGLGLNAFMSSGTEQGNDEISDEDRLVNAGYGSGSNDGTEKNTDEYIYNDISGEVPKVNNNISSDEYNDNTDVNNDSAIDEYIDNESVSYGYSGYRAISENNLLVIYEYSNGNVISEKITDIQTDILPEYDRDMLKNGIDIGDESGVYELLQDYEG